MNTPRIRFIALVCAVTFAALPVAAHSAERKSQHPSAAASKTKAAKASTRNVKKSARGTQAVKGRHAAAHKLHKTAVHPSVPVHAHRMLVRQDDAVDREGNPFLKSNAFMVQDLNSGKILLERNAEAVVPIASITKLMTAMVVLDARLPLGETLYVTDDDTDKLKSTSSRIVVGAALTREELIHLALMSSENRAAAALGRNYPGGIGAFVAAMNRKARELGLGETVFHDSTGLNPNNVSSARDLARMVVAASHYPLIREFSTDDEETVNINGRVLSFHNTNALVKSPDWQIGVSKTGFINEAGRCLVMQAWFANKPMVIVLLDSVGKFTRIADAQRVKRWIETAVAQNGIRAGAG